MSTIFINVGEASGDLLGGNLAKMLFKLHPQGAIAGVGGVHMEQAGVTLIENLEKMGVVGGFELLKHAKDIYLVLKKIKSYLTDRPPDLLILIDYPGLNLHLASFAKKHGIRVLFYVSPQIWAWRYGRIKKIRRSVSHMAVLYRFEEALYQKEHIPVTFVGHPLKSLAKPTLSKEMIYKKLNLNPNHKVVALFPGSRKQEITLLLPVILAAKKNIQEQLPGVQFALPIASTLKKQDFIGKVPHDVILVEHDTYNLLAISDAAITASGTATLEISLMNVPLVILYKLNPLTYWLARCLVKEIPFFGLCNIISKKRVAKEYLQNNATAKNIADETLRLLQDESYREQIKKELKKIEGELGSGDPAQKTAEIALNLLGIKLPAHS